MTGASVFAIGAPSEPFYDALHEPLATMLSGIAIEKRLTHATRHAVKNRGGCVVDLELAGDGHGDESGPRLDLF